MAGKWHKWRGFALALALVPAGLAVPARAQEATLQELRMRQLEASVRALQGQVFANGHSGSPVATPGAAPAPTAGPMTDMLTRIDAIEAQIARLTAQNEELGNRLRQIEAKAAAAAAPAPAPVAAAPAASGPAQLVPEKPAEKTTTAGNLAAMGVAPAAKPAIAPKPAVNGKAAPAPVTKAAPAPIAKPAATAVAAEASFYGRS